MNNSNKITKTLALGISAIFLNHGAWSGGYSLYEENSARAVGNVAAGIAAEGADASTGWYNPAGLVLLKHRQVLLSGVGVLPTSLITGSATYTTPTLPPYVESFHNMRGGKDGLVPSIHAAIPFGDRYALGLNVVAPEGLSSQYPTDSPVRYAALMSSFTTASFSPVLAAKLSETLSIGGGVDLQYATLGFSSMIGAPALMTSLGLPSTFLDSQVTNNGKSFGVGFHAGFLFRFQNDHTRIGMNYESNVKHQFKGSSVLRGRMADPSLNVFNPIAGNPAASFRTNNFQTNTITFPSVTTLSGYQDLNEKWALLGSIVYTQWSAIQLFDLDNLAASGANSLGNINLNEYNSTSPQDYRNTWRYAVGLNYKMTRNVMLRGGVGCDQTPTVNKARNVNLPDTNVFVFAGGVHYQMYEQFGLDIGYSYYMKTASTSINSGYVFGNSTYNINAISSSYHGNLVGLQLVWTGDKAVSK